MFDPSVDDIVLHWFLFFDIFFLLRNVSILDKLFLRGDAVATTQATGTKASTSSFFAWTFVF
jgi:hypothetical protein